MVAALAVNASPDVTLSASGLRNTAEMAAGDRPVEPLIEAVLSPPYREAFLRCGGVVYALSTLLLLVLALGVTGGRLIYLIDDPAIHLSVAENLAHHGTWGVVPGHFQSASSSPLWTVLLGGYVAVAGMARGIGVPVPDSVGPLLLNLVAGLGILAVVAGEQRVLLPGRRRPLDALAVAVLVVVVLFLPGLTLLGMEHSLHTALVLSAVVLFHRASVGRSLGWPPSLPYVLLGLATLVRFETVFIAAGLCVALVVTGVSDRHGTARERLAAPLRRVVLVGTAVGLSLGAFALFNRAMGQGWLPNSVLAKGQGINGAADSAFRIAAVLGRLTGDPLLVAMVVVACGALLAAGRQRRRFTFPTVVFLVAVAGHVALAQIGWFERYQAYLIALGVMALLIVADDTVPSGRRAPVRASFIPGLIVVSLLLTITKVGLTVRVPRAVEDTYQQRYQAARFLARYYDGEPVATGELGYVSLEHRGPVTDLFGLGDYQVLQARRDAHQALGAAYWRQLARDRGFKVVAVYPSTLLFDTPEDWILVGTWHLNRETTTALEPTFQFWAADPAEVAPLARHLREFERELPAGALTLDPLAGYRAGSAGPAG